MSDGLQPPDDLSKWVGGVVITAALAVVVKIITGNSAKLEKADEQWKGETTAALKSIKDLLARVERTLDGHTRDIVDLRESRARDHAEFDKDIVNLTKRIDGIGVNYQSKVDALAAELRAVVATFSRRDAP